ncbi:NifU family protein [uncultured Clostridium sp.]|uniref:NifU family protein n=1 Tax=uncultured Clostridium sp. TaxID=59620 RepID=UPI0028E3ED85|nr:NifU family protein [uncultured Clostridium sp.]
MIENIEKIIDSEIRPYLKEHYGDIELLGFHDGIVEVKLIGQCNGCPSAKYTVEDVIESKLKEEFKEVEKVTLINEVSEELLHMARKILCGSR